MIVDSRLFLFLLLRRISLFIGSVGFAGVYGARRMYCLTSGVLSALQVPTNAGLLGRQQTLDPSLDRYLTIG
jgi:hypothetical protein